MALDETRPRDTAPRVDLRDDVRVAGGTASPTRCPYCHDQIPVEEFGRALVCETCDRRAGCGAMTRSLVALALALLLAGCASAPQVVAQLPDRTLEAPDGRRHSTVALAARGAVFVVAPATLSSVDDQRDWGTHLDATRSGPAALVFVEDFGPSWFEDTVLEEMRKQYDPRGGVVMLIDPEGELRDALGVPEGDVVVLVYSAERRLLKTIPGPPTREAAASAWAALASRRGR